MSINKKNLSRNVKRAATGAVTAAAVIAGNASALGTDFSAILTGVDGATAATAIVAAAAILALVGFAKWGAKKVGGFFG